MEGKQQQAGPGDEGRPGDQIERALSVLRAGGTVGYPSETVWGLAALPWSRAAVDRLYQLKGRASDKPVQLSCSTLREARSWLRPESLLDRLARFWPGPLTVLAWAAPGCPEWLAPGGVVGLRVPDHPLAQGLLAAAGGTLASTSLNPSGMAPATTFEQARSYHLADLLLDSPDAGTLPRTSGLASTVFDLRTRQVLRQGAISQAELAQALS